MAIGRLPNLIVAGVPKAGTGSLFAYLRQHPEICAGDQKEIGYFNYFNPSREQGEPPPVEDYMRHFAGCGSERYALDATPSYSYGGSPVIAAIQRTLPHPRVIITLRDPVDRLWSAYTFQRTLGNITDVNSFNEFLDRCEQRRLQGTVPAPRDHLHGLHIGYYADYLGAWLDAFGDDVRVLFTEQMSRDPHGTVAGIFDWLDVDSAVTAMMDLLPRNRTQHARSPRAAKLIFGAKRAVDRLGRVHPRIRGPLRRAYERVNTAALPEQLDQTTRARAEELYLTSNQASAALLTERGYTVLPSWLQRATVQG